jgi:dihydrolipoamide dehydrogenase
VASEFDLAVLGGGPGGYTAAIRAAQLGMSAVVIEREALGGVCGNWGCIPSKAILSAAEIYDRARRGAEMGIVAGNLSFDYAKIVAHSRASAERVSRGVASLLRKHKIPMIAGEGRLDAQRRLVVTGEKGSEPVAAARILLAAGSGEKLLPGMSIAPPRVVTSRELLAETTLPASIAIVGGGVIGVEFGYALAALGVAVTIVELEAQLLPGAEPEIARELARSFGRRGISVRTRCAFRSLAVDGDGVRLEAEEKGQVVELRAERCLVAVGRRPLSAEIGAQEAGIALEKGFVVVDERYQTSVEGVFAIGDLIASPQLAHVASAEGVAAVETMAGVRPPGRIDPRRIPACVYSHPEVATIGLTEAAARAAGYDVKTGLAPLRAFGRAVAGGETEGLVKIVSETRYGEILGCHIVGACATEIIAEAAVAIGLESTVHDLARTVHAHPTFAEAVMEGAALTLGEAINL